MSNLPDILFRKDYRTLPIFISFLERFSFKGCHGPALKSFYLQLQFLSGVMHLVRVWLSAKSCFDTRDVKDLLRFKSKLRLD